MVGVLEGFALILGVIGIGYLAGRLGVVRGDQRLTLNRVAFFVATPALMFTVLHRSDISVLRSPVILVTTVAALVVAASFIVISRVWFPRDLATTTLAATGSGYVNSNNLGLPVAVYILGDAAYVAPLIIVQLALYAPVILSILDSTRTGRAPGSGVRGVLRAVGRAFTNPIIIACLAGVLCALFAVPVPKLVLAPLEMIGGAAIPMVLLSFGISLHGQRALQPGTGVRLVLVSTALKVVAMPLVAWGLGTAIGLAPHQLFVATVIAALPTAQNVYNYAATYGRAETIVRDIVFVTTFASLPVIALIAWLLGDPTP